MKKINGVEIVDRWAEVFPWFRKYLPSIADMIVELSRAEAQVAKLSIKPADGMVSLDAVEAAILEECKSISWENTTACINAATFAKEVRAYLCSPKMLQERIEERFRSARDNDDAYTPDALAVIAMEELAKERHEN